MSITNNLNSSLAQRAVLEERDFEDSDSTMVDTNQNIQDLASCLNYLKGPISKNALVFKTLFPGNDAKEDYEVCEALINSGRIDLHKTFRSAGPALTNVCRSLNKPLVELILSRGDNDPRLASGCLWTVFCNRKEEGDKYAIAQLLWDRFGVDQVKPDYEEYREVLGRLGFQGDALLPELGQEITRVLAAKEGVPFDTGFLKRLSGIYQNFWTDLGRNGEPIDRHRFEEAHANFPHKTAAINFQPQMFEVYLAMQEMEKLKGFPLSELWRFAIDAHKQEIGCCAFESEPGYLKGFFQGMLFAIESRKEPKTAAWYVELHKKVVDGVLTSQSITDDSEHILRSGYRSINPEIRTFKVQFLLKFEDKDPIGIEDLITRETTREYTFDKDKQLVLYSNGNSTARRNDYVFGSFNRLLPTMTSRAQKLLLFLWTARELELEHIFFDANGRGSHLIFLSLVLGEDDLPPFLFPNPNVFDANGPESLIYRYLEGCVNFRRGGVGHTFKKEKSVKKLGTLTLEDQDLIALREELRPYVEGKSWKDVREMLFT